MPVDPGAPMMRSVAKATPIRERPVIADYIARGLARPAFERAVAAQLKSFEGKDGVDEA